MQINPIQRQSIMQSYHDRPVEKVNNRRTFSIDEVSFSENALTFAKTLSDVRQGLDVKAASGNGRICEISGKISNGEYYVDSATVADKIIRNILLGL